LQIPQKYFIFAVRFSPHSPHEILNIMANITPIIHHFRTDGTARVILLLTHRSQRKKISTEIFVTRADVTKGGRIKSEGIKNEIEKIIAGYRTTMIKLGFAISNMTIDELKTAITSQCEQHIDFYNFANEVIENMKINGRSSYKNFAATINSLQRFTGTQQLPINQITLDFIQKYEAWLRNTPSSKHKKNDNKPALPIGSRGITLYMGTIRFLINQARLRYNNEETGIINVKVDPFSRYKMPIEQTEEKPVLTIDQMRKIKAADITQENKRMKFARDIFLLSFYLIGMNAEDLFTCESKVKEGTITYYRSKTTNRRKDRAKLVVKIEPEADVLFKEYLDHEGTRLFNFHKYYATTNNFNIALNKGLAQLALKLSLPGITFYSARHTWATLAANECRINLYTIHKALNHADTKMQITKTYIREDFRDIWDANRQVLDLLK